MRHGTEGSPFAIRGSKTREVRRRFKFDHAEHIMFGPVVEDAIEVGKFCFVVVSGAVDRRPYCHIGQMTSRDRDLAEQLRQKFLMAAIRPAVSVHDFDDELRLASFGEVLWPNKFRPIRATIEAERASALH